MTSPLPIRHLGKSGLRVSNICLGTMTFGVSSPRPGQAGETLAHQIMDKYSDIYGGNFIDTANVYSNGEAERIVGSWLQKREREDFVVATKARFQMGPNGNAHSSSLSRKHLLSAIVGSLERLQTDYVDLYQCHCWDNGTPLEETLRAMDDLIKAGKVRHFGVSNFCGWQIQKLVDMSKYMGLSHCISVQNEYSLMARGSEMEVFDVCRNEGVGLLPWSPLKGGILSGKFSSDMTEAPVGTRVRYATDTNSTLHSHPTWHTMNQDSVWNLLAAMETIAKSHGKSVAQVAIRWLLQKDVVSSVVIGVKTMSQLDDNIGAGAGWKLSDEEMEMLDDLSAYDTPNPYRMIWDRNADKPGPLGPRTSSKSQDDITSTLTI